MANIRELLNAVENRHQEFFNACSYIAIGAKLNDESHKFYQTYHALCESIDEADDTGKYNDVDPGLLRCRYWFCIAAIALGNIGKAAEALLDYKDVIDCYNCADEASEMEDLQ